MAQLLDRDSILEAIQQEQERLSNHLAVSGSYHDIIDGITSFLEVLRETDGAVDYKARRDRLLNARGLLEMKVARRSRGTVQILDRITDLTEKIGTNS